LQILLSLHSAFRIFTLMRTSMHQLLISVANGDQNVLVAMMWSCKNIMSVHSILYYCSMDIDNDT